jgi:secondary thiamine-phosphate synthase enzyme
MKELTVVTPRKRVLVDITDDVGRAIGGEDGVWMVFVPHTTAGVTINEGDDPAVATDILGRLEALAPEDAGYDHAEGNAPAHVMASLVGSSVLLAVDGGRLRLGRWQSIFFCEFDGPRTRQAWLERAGGGAR